MVKSKRIVIDYADLARHLIGFAVVVFVEDKYFKQLANKTHISLNYGDILVFFHKELTESYPYTQYCEDMHSFSCSLRASVIDMQKRGVYNFGEVLFYSDAKLKEYHTQRHQTDSLEEKCKIYKLENVELKSRIKEISQQQIDLQQTAELLRIAQKRIETLTKELHASNEAYQRLIDETNKKEDAYRKSVELIRFYQQLIDIAAQFPTDKNLLCDWAERMFSTEIVVSGRARSEMRKYNGSLDLISLCDGIVFLSSYAKYRRHEISEDILALYAERKHWEIQGCGKEALKMHRMEYTVTINGISFLLDQHIKHGIHAEELIRIYFCWDDKIQKVVIGSMPGHLATIKNST